MNIKSKIKKLFVVSGMVLGMGSITNANAFILNTFNLDFNGAAMTISGLDSTSDEFMVNLGLSTQFGSSSISTIGPLTSMPVGGSMTTNSIVVNGAIGLDNPFTAGLEFERNYNNRTVFSGAITSTLNSLIGVIPTTLDSSSANFSGQITNIYDGTFSDFPLLGITGAGAGSITVAFAFDTLSDILTLNISESTISGPNIKAALKNLDGFGGGPIDGSVSAIVYAGDTISVDGNNVITSTGHFVITQTQRVPEPASLALIGLGVLGMGAVRVRRGRNIR